VKITVRLAARATLEWAGVGGIKSAVLETVDVDQSPHVTVYLTPSDDDWIEGSIVEVMAQAHDLVERKKAGIGLVDTIDTVIGALLAQPIPRVTLDKTELDAELGRVRERRRAWLIEQIEDGVFAAIGMLKNEFGETVKINVEVVGA